MSVAAVQSVLCAKAKIIAPVEVQQHTCVRLRCHEMRPIAAVMFPYLHQHVTHVRS